MGDRLSYLILSCIFVLFHNNQNMLQMLLKVIRQTTKFCDIYGFVFDFKPNAEHMGKAGD